MPETFWLSLVLVAVSVLLGIGYFRSRAKLSDLRTRFAPIVAADAEAWKIKEAASSAAHLVRLEAESTKASAGFTAHRAEATLRLMDVTPAEPEPSEVR